MVSKSSAYKTEYHWFDEPDAVRIKLEKGFWKVLINKAIAKAGSKTKLSKATKLCNETIRNYFYNRHLTVRGLKKILDFLDMEYSTAENKVSEISWSKGVKLPIKLNTEPMATILAAVLGDGTLGEAHVEYTPSCALRRAQVSPASGGKIAFGDLTASDTKTAGLSDRAVF